MEVVFDEAQGLPEGAVLSIKIGETKRQAPVSNVGQAFRFASLASGLPMEVQVLVPAAPVQLVNLPPEEQSLVDLGGGMKVSLSHRESTEIPRPQVDVLGLAEGKGLTQDKIKAAQQAASYLEEHDLIKTFQEMLHGLLVSRPSDPFAFVEARMAKAKICAPASQPPSPPSKESRALDPVVELGSESSVGGDRKARVRLAQREAPVGAHSKVDTLLMALQSAQDNIVVVKPFLPDDLRELIESAALVEDCQKQFDSLDSKKEGRLCPSDLIQVIQEMTQCSVSNITEAQCRKFLDMFDIDHDELISVDEFTNLVKSVIVAGFLESPAGRKAIELAMVQENHFNDFLAMIEADRERLWSILPFLPKWLVTHVTSVDFHKACSENFEALDTDQSGSLEPNELIPIVQTLSEAHPLTIDVEKSRRFTSLFDPAENGFIRKDDFIEFAQFVTVMNFLSNSAEGQQLKARTFQLEANRKMANFITILEEDPNRIGEVLRELPQSLVAEISVALFKDDCNKGFESLDPMHLELLPASDLVPVICALSRRFVFDLNEEDCAKYIAFFAKDGRSITKVDFVQLARYVMTMAFLHDTQRKQDSLEAEVALGQEKISQLLSALQEGVDKIADIIPFLPRDFLDMLFTDDFAVQCGNDFQELDKDWSGVLEPTELLPVILNMVEAQQLCLTEEHATQFVDIFDAEGNGVITKGEFANFVRFMMIMAFMQTEDGRQAEEKMKLAQSQEAVEDLLRMLEQDRKAIHKIVPLLPPDVYAEMTSDNFVMSCHTRFAELDKERKGMLRPRDLLSVVAELSSTQIASVTEEQCMRFTAIFDLYGDGVLRPEEFLDFSRFLCIMSYLHTPEGKEGVKDALRILADSKKIEDLLEELNNDHRDINKVIPYLPEWLRADVLSERFTVECFRYFQELDKDGNGMLDPEELFPLVLSLSHSHQQSLDIDQCRRFTAIFDEAQNGVITKTEFVEFSRFLIIMGYLRSQEGQQVMQSAWVKTQRPSGDGYASEESPSKAPSGAPEAEVTAPGRLEGCGMLSITPLVDSCNDVLQANATDLCVSQPGSPAHLVVDCEFYQRKSERLVVENEQLRSRLQRLEVLVRQMEHKMEDQSRSLRHAEVDLRATGGTR